MREDDEKIRSKWLGIWRFLALILEASIYLNQETQCGHGRNGLEVEY